MVIRSLFSHPRLCRFPVNIKYQSNIHYLRHELVRQASAYNGPAMPDQASQVGPQEEPREGLEKSTKGDRANGWSSTLHRMFESAATTAVSITVLGYVLDFKP